MPTLLVNITQWLECQFVVLKVAGSNPVIHPSLYGFWAYNSVVRVYA